MGDQREGDPVPQQAPPLPPSFGVSAVCQALQFGPLNMLLLYLRVYKVLSVPFHPFRAPLGTVRVYRNGS